MRKILDKTKCSRCQEAAPSIHIRNEGFCEHCFVRFISHKFNKRLDAFRVNYHSPETPKLIVSVDFGRNSMALVSLLESLQEVHRLKHGRLGFEFEPVYIGNDSFEWPFATPLTRIDSLKLAQMFYLDNEPYRRPQDLSRTSLQDLEGWMKRAAVKKYARGRTTLYDYSMSRVSELVMAETCKGRGSLVPQLLAPEGCIYPLADILDSELEIYAAQRNLKFCQRPSFPRVSKLQSIDELIHQFLADTRKEFPAIDSTVARTGLKLSQAPEPCCLCEGSGKGLCYGCKKMLHGQTQKRLEVRDVLNEFEL